MDNDQKKKDVRDYLKILGSILKYLIAAFGLGYLGLGLGVLVTRSQIGGVIGMSIGLILILVAIIRDFKRSKDRS